MSDHKEKAGDSTPGGGFGPFDARWGGGFEVLKALLEGSREAIFMLDSDGWVIMANKVAEALFPLEDLREEGGRLHIKSLFSEAEAWERFWEDIIRRSPIQGLRARLKGRDGRPLEGLITSQPIREETPGGICNLIFIRDVTSKYRTLGHIRHQHTLLNILSTVAITANSSLKLNEVLDRTIDQILKLLEAASVRIYILEQDQRHLRLAAWKGVSERFINKPYFQRRRVGEGLLGKTILTRKAQVVDNFLRADDPYVDCIIEEGLKSSVYIPLVSKDRPVGVMCVSSHQEFRFSSDFVDFLNTIGNQIGLAIENANLYESAMRALQEAKEAQEQVIRTEKLASLGKLSATIAHEINNPLSVVLTYIKLMRKIISRGNLGSERINDVDRYLNTMESETARCGEIVKNLLAFARQSTVKVEDHPVGEIIERTTALISHEMEIREMNLVTMVEPGLPPVRCDFRQIQQALLNIMMNAIEAMDKGGTLTVEAGLSPKEGFLQVRISDTGCGIPEEEIHNIFEPFYTTKEEAKGVGLGLSVVYGIVTRQGGSIDVESKEGVGTTFTVHLPVGGHQELSAQS
jgi:two-component system NtrC family sensor kinase